MQDSPDGLIPTKGFLQNCMQPSPDFNDGSPIMSTQVTDENGELKEVPTLVAPVRDNKNIRYKYSVLEFAEVIDSSSMDGSNWNQILQSICHNWAGFDAFVVLHGTDTLAYTASALAFMLGKLDKTVIVTGSQLSMYAPNNDAHDNLLDCLTVAALFDISEVSVVFHHHLYRATRVTKVSAYSMAAFTTPNAKALASFPKSAGQSWAVHTHSKSVQHASMRESYKTAESNGAVKASSQGVIDTSRVAVLKVYPGISGNLISSIVSIPNLGGLIIETFGAGNIPMGSGSRDLLEILSTAVQNGIVVVSVTQCTLIWLCA